MLLTREEMTLHREAPRFSIETDREAILRALSHLFYGEVGGQNRPVGDKGPGLGRHVGNRQADA